MTDLLGSCLYGVLLCPRKVLFVFNFQMWLLFKFESKKAVKSKLVKHVLFRNYPRIIMLLSKEVFKCCDMFPSGKPIAFKQEPNEDH